MRPVSAAEFIEMTVDVPLLGYLDPGAGSMLLQVLLGGFAAMGVIGRFVWQRMRRRRDAKTK